MPPVPDHVRERVLANVERRTDEMVRFLQELIRYPSTDPPGRERECSEHVARRLAELGLEPKLYECQPERPNVVAILKGTGGGMNLVYYGGHVDVVPEGDRDSWERDPFGGELVDGWIYGRGAADHKAPIAASITALAAILDEDIKLKGDLVYTVVVDEESGGEDGAGYLCREGLVYGDYGIYATLGKINQVKIGSKGPVQGLIRVQGKMAHGSAPWEAINPIEKAAKLVLALQSMKFEKSNPYWGEPNGVLGGPTGVLSVTMIEAGVRVNVIPEFCDVSFDRRIIPEETPEEAIGQIQAVIDRLQAEDPDFKATIHKIHQADGAVFVHPDTEIVGVIKDAIRGIGLEPEIGCSAGSSDTRWFMKAGIPMVAYGTGGYNPQGKLAIHAPNECISVAEVKQVAKAHALIMLGACGVAE
ncbi:MAG: M20 family metallopeptidase [Chloroflexi bacterium]|nr:M20 family metallopeptidase [Chloroflexota bacterium]